MPTTKNPPSKPLRPSSNKKAHAAPVPVAVPTNVPHAPMVRMLAERLRADPDSPDVPLTVLNRIPQTKSVHLLVVWDKWKDLPIPARARVITDAFAAAFPADDAVVRLPIGVTSGEALTQGYLCYQIIPLPRPSDHVTAKQLKDAMESAGGVLLQLGGERHLRFATRGQAEGAYRRLLEKINKPIWTLSVEPNSSGSGE